MSHEEKILRETLKLLYRYKKRSNDSKQIYRMGIWMDVLEDRILALQLQSVGIFDSGEDNKAS